MKKDEKASRVVAEIRGRASAGHPLNSGSNRGDWLYAAAVGTFGSWGAAVEAAGFDYASIKKRPLTADEVLVRLRVLAATQDSLQPTRHAALNRAAQRHYGAWAIALEAAGIPQPDNRKWTAQRVIDQIRVEEAAGRSLRSNAVRKRNENLYMAGRRRFGTWQAAVQAARQSADQE